MSKQEKEDMKKMKKKMKKMKKKMKKMKKDIKKMKKDIYKPHDHKSYSYYNALLNVANNLTYKHYGHKH
jgi:septal ring factor EnvC (AmiA/AmiB activator)